MTFDLTPEQEALIANATRTTNLPDRALDAVLVVEERVRQATESLSLAFEGESDRLRARLLAAATALGIGRAAVAHAVSAMKSNGVVAGPDTTVPHWAVADGATDVAAARLLTYSAAEAFDRDEAVEDVISRALDFAARAAQRAVDAAIRVAGPAAFAEGGMLDRLSRDARRMQIILR